MSITIPVRATQDCKHSTMKVEGGRLEVILAIAQDTIDRQSPPVARTLHVFYTPQVPAAHHSLHIDARRVRPYSRSVDLGADIPHIGPTTAREGCPEIIRRHWNMVEQMVYALIGKYNIIGVETLLEKVQPYDSARRAS